MKTMPMASAYVADITTEEQRSRGIAWLGVATSLGVIVGPAFAGLLTRQDIHWSARAGHFVVDAASVPFFAAAALALLAWPAAVWWLPESRLPGGSPGVAPAAPLWRHLLTHLRRLLALAVTAQFGLAVFEATFALHARGTLGMVRNRSGRRSWCAEWS